MGVTWNGDEGQRPRALGSDKPRHRPWVDRPLAWLLVGLVALSAVGLGLLALALVNPH